MSSKYGVGNNYKQEYKIHKNRKLDFDYNGQELNVNKIQKANNVLLQKTYNRSH